jgi:hypothetical protein
MSRKLFMPKKNGATLICRVVTAAFICLGFTTLALPFSRVHLPHRADLATTIRVLPVSVQVSKSITIEPKVMARPVISAQEGELHSRLLSEYGAVLMARNGVVPPPREIFSSDEEVVRWQASVETSGDEYVLQTAAADALEAARAEAHAENLDITPRDTDAAARGYQYTVRLWMSRVEPGLDHWVKKGRLSPAQADRIRRFPSREQVGAILQLEKKGMFFSKDFSKSILYSVAPPGASQHLALLAFDVKEHDNARVREILEKHGWFQTVQRDEPHFTYLGVTASELPSVGLTRVIRGQRHYWIPRPTTNSMSAALFARR